MIGQRELLNKITAQIEKDRFPKVSILIGEKGSGRKTLAYEISKRLNCGITFVPPTSEGIARIFNVAYKVDSALPMVYVFTECDSLNKKYMDVIRVMTQNVPNNAFLILTCEMLDNIFPVIKSKSVTYMLEPYSDEDKFDYLDDVKRENQMCLLEEDEDFIVEVASNISELKMFIDMDVSSFKKYVIEAVTYIVNKPNDISTDIASKIAFKEEDSKYPLRLFWKAFIAICGDLARTTNDSLMYCRFIAITGDSLQQLPIDISEEKVYYEWEIKIGEEKEKFRD